MCTDAGCDSILTIEFTEVDIEPEETYTIDICVDDECVSETITIDVPHPGTGEIIRGETEGHRGTPEGRMLVWADDDRIDFFLPDQEYGETAQVSFSLTTSDGDVLAEVDSEDVPLQRSQPNGPGCPPICFSGRLTI